MKKPYPSLLTGILFHEKFIENLNKAMVKRLEFEIKKKDIENSKNFINHYRWLFGDQEVINDLVIKYYEGDQLDYLLKNSNQ